MILKDKIRQVLREHYGNFDTMLEHDYEDKVTTYLFEGDIEIKQAWVTYNQVILELKNTLKDMLKVKELQYKLTEDTNPSSVCIEVIDGIQDKSPELKRLYEKIKTFEA
jgi:cytochrome b involved in lipid metabolism